MLVLVHVTDAVQTTAIVFQQRTGAASNFTEGIKRIYITSRQDRSFSRAGNLDDF